MSQLVSLYLFVKNYQEEAASEKAQKILHNGILYILRPDGAIYNATGVRVK